MVRGGGCSCSTASSEFLQIINWPRLPFCSTGWEKEVESGGGREQGTRPWERRLSGRWKSLDEGKRERSGASTQRGGRNRRLEEDASGGPHFTTSKPQQVGQWGGGGAVGGHLASGALAPHPSLF